MRHRPPVVPRHQAVQGGLVQRSQPAQHQPLGAFADALAVGGQVEAQVRITAPAGDVEPAVDELDGVQRSVQAGMVPYFLITFDPDRRFQNIQDENRVENAFDDLAKKTGGRSIFRRSSTEVLVFVNKLLSRIRNQYELSVEFPCYRPAPATDHLAVLKVEGRDADGLRFQAPSKLAPEPLITSVVPSGATQDEVDEGDVEVTINGRGFCGLLGSIKTFVGDRPIQLSSADPYRLVAKIPPDVETGDVKVINRFGEVSESDLQFKVVSPEPGEDASTTLVFLIVAIVATAVVGVLFFAFRSRRARVDAAVQKRARPAGASPPREPMLVGIDAAQTVPMRPIAAAWIEHADGRTVALDDGENMIGRDETCAVRLDIPGVSREHARLELNSVHGALWLEDMGSTNGTFWGKPGTQASAAMKLRSRQMLGSGDVIVIGGERMIVHFER